MELLFLNLDTKYTVVCKNVKKICVKSASLIKLLSFELEKNIACRLHVHTYILNGELIDQVFAIEPDFATDLY